MFQKVPRIKDQAYLRFMASMPCIVTGQVSDNVVPHHILRGVNRGVGMKSPDNCVIPLCFQQHNLLHESGDETGFLAQNGIVDAPKLANRLYDLYLEKDYDGMKKLILTKGEEQ